MGKRNSLVVGLDVATTKVSAVVGELTPEGDLEIIGVGHRPCKGMRKGVLLNIDSTVEAMGAALEDAEVMAGVRIDTAYVGITAGQVEGLQAAGSIELQAKSVTLRGIQQVIETTRSLTLSSERDVLHVIPQEFTLDGEEGIPNPVGMAGAKLEVRAYVITAAATAVQSMLKAVDLTRITVSELVAGHLASAEAVLTAEEKHVGVALIEIGGGITDIAVYSEGGPKHIASLAVGGNHVTHDIAVGLRTPVGEAERIKKQFGCALLSMVRAEDMVDVHTVGGKETQRVPRKFLVEIIEPRVEEIFALALHNIQQGGFFDAIPAGVVITGGATIMPGMVEAAEEVFELPVRIGLPIGISGLTDIVTNPIYATGVGLALYGRNRLLEAAAAHSGRTGLGGAFRRMAVWLQDLF
ncbi:MAG: cell division protein FtsA [Nitrospinae bacterium]|nr:cell division protein FtsA [Nitrospinota bacterium]